MKYPKTTNHAVNPITVYTVGHFSVETKDVYETLEKALRRVLYSKIEINPHRPDSILIRARYMYESREYKFRDGCGDIIPPSTLIKKINELEALIEKNRKSYFYGRKHISEDHFRRMPVPNIHSRWGRGSSDRRMKTRQEMRENLSIHDDEISEDFGLKIRGKRRNLPTLWDDVPVAKTINNWKAHRKTQWK